MEALTVVLFQRTALLLLLAFLLTRVPSFRQLLDRRVGVRTILYHSFIFGLFGIAGVQAGVVIESVGEFSGHLWVSGLADDEIIVGAGLVAVVIAGLLGGPVVGFGAGVIVAAYVLFLGGALPVASSLVHPLSGLIAGGMARFFSDERVIAPAKAFFIGVFMPILYMGFLLMFSVQPEKAIALVDWIGLPLVVTHSTAIAIFTAMIRVALGEVEQEAALATKKALYIAEKALPHLKRGWNEESAEQMARLLYRELRVAAVSLSDHERVLAHVGAGSDHHYAGERLHDAWDREKSALGKTRIVDEKRCPKNDCPLKACVIVPVCQANRLRGLIHLYFWRVQQIRPVELAFCEGLGKLVSHQLEIAEAERLREVLRDAELRHLQAQIQPHFLFNTLQSIAVLVRVRPREARRLVIRLSQLMRGNFQLAEKPLIPLEKELEHLRAYVEIVQVRFADRINVRYAVQEEALNAVIPPFTLQPIVENSVKHGLRDVSTGGEIAIEIAVKAGRVCVAICDNGTGVNDWQLSTLGRRMNAGEKQGGTGLYNVNERLTHLFGKEAALVFTSRKGGGLKTAFCLPYQHKNTPSQGGQRKQRAPFQRKQSSAAESAGQSRNSFF